MLKFILSSKFQMNKTSFYNLANNFKMFARKEINKASLIENFLNVNRIEQKPKNIQLNQNLNFIVDKEIIQNNSIFAYEDVKNLLDKNLLNLKVGDTPQTKFLVSLKKNLNDNKLLQCQKFLETLNEIALNYSQGNSNFYESTVFKFIVLIDQILSKRSLAEYQQANLTHFAFSHLINYFGQNFFSIFEKNPEILLNYNFLYFMAINKGEISECLKAVIDHVPNKQNLYKILSTQFVIKTEDSQMEKIHKRKYFDSIEKNVNTPSSDLIKDYKFKYNDRNMKIKLLNENVKEKQDYEKMRLVYNNLIKFRNLNESIDSVFLKDLEKYLNAFFPQIRNDSLNLYSEDFVQIKTAIDNFNKYLKNKLSLLTKIPINNKLIDSITFSTIHEVFNPVFSGENDLSAQFTVVAEHFGNLYALELLYNYLDSQKEGEVFSFNDLYQLNLILVPFKFYKLEGVIENVRFLSEKSEVLKEIQLNLKTNSKYKIGKLFVTEEVESKSKKQEETREKSERNTKQSNFTEKRQVSEKSNRKENEVTPPKKEKMVFNKPQDKKQNFNATMFNIKKETIFEDKSSNIEVEKEKQLPIKKEETKSVEFKKEESHLAEVKREESIPVETKNENTIPVEMINENTIPTEMVCDSIKVQVEAKIVTNDNQTTTITQSTNTEIKPEESIIKESISEKVTKKTESISLHKCEDTHESIHRNKNKTVNYDRESTHKNPFYKTNRRGYSASIDRENNKSEESPKPIGQIYKEIKSIQRKEKSEAKQANEIGEKQEFTKQTSQSVNNENKKVSTKSVEKSQKNEFVVTPKKSQENKESSATIKKQQQFVVPQKLPQEQPNKTNEEKKLPSARKYKPTLKIFEPIKYQKIRHQVVTEQEKSSTEVKELNVPKNTLLEKLGKLSAEMKEQDESFYNTYLEQNRDNIDIKLAQKKFDLNYWLDKILNENVEEMEAQDLEKHIYTNISKVLRKYISNRDKFLMVIYSLTNPALKNEVVLDLEYCFYQIFNNSPQSFDLNLGHIGYQTLLNNNLLDTSIKNRENLEKIIYHMEKNYYLPNNQNIKTILQICDKNFYPKYLKNLIDNYVINKNILLDVENFTYYIQIITNFEDFSQYYQNLINSSFTDFKIPVKAEFFEYLIYKYLTKMDFEKVKSILRNLNQRYITEYKEEDERLETIYSGNNLILYNIVQLVENAKERENNKAPHSHESYEINSIHEITKNSKNFIEIANNIIAQNKSFNKDWMEDNEFTFLLIKLYHEFSYNLNEYFTILDSLMTRNEVETIFDPKKLYNDLLEIFKLNGGKLTPDEHKLAIEVFERFLETYIRNGTLELTFEDKFKVLRHENLFRYVRFFRNSKEENEDKTSNMQLFVKFLDTVLDPLTYLRMHKIDKVNLEKVLFKVFNNNNNKVLEYMYKLDIRRKLNDAKSTKNAEANKLEEEIEDEVIEKYSLLDIEDDSLSFKEN